MMISVTVPRKNVRVHLPEIQTWVGFLQILTLGNLIVLMETVNYRSYLDWSSSDSLAEKSEHLNFLSQIHYAKENFAKFRTWFLDHHQVVSQGEQEPVDIEKDIFQVKWQHHLINQSDYFFKM